MSTTRTVVGRVQDWYLTQCDGDWEHSYGIKIETLDNPGWLVTVDLKDTAWEQIRAPRKIIQRSEADWVQSEVADFRFIGSGGVSNLEEVLGIFLDIVNTAASESGDA